MNKANLRILGVVLNDVPPVGVDSYRYHSHYYGPQPQEVEGEVKPVLPLPSEGTRGEDDEL